MTQRILHDWEFIEDGVRIFPISVALKNVETGRELYRVFSDIDPIAIQQNAWLHENVWPKLRKDGKGPINFTEIYVRSRTAIRLDIAEFLRQSYADATPGEVELWANYGAYDHVALAQLWGRMVALPPYVPMCTHDIQTLLRQRCLQEVWLPKQDPATEHNALADVRHEADILAFIAEYDMTAKGADRQRLLSEAVEGRWRKG